MEVKIISLGGSMIAPDQVDTAYLSQFQKLINGWLKKDSERKIILITGGGAPARIYQKAFRDLVPGAESDAQDWIGIAATRLNGELVKQLFGDSCREPVVTDPTVPESFRGQVLVAAGWKPGFSTDFDAVMLAQKFGAKEMVNLSNVSKVYTDDPKTNPEAKPLDELNWDQYRKIVGEDWTPGKNAPFDPVATRKAQELGLTVFFCHGSDLKGLENILHGKSFEGTVIKDN